MLFATLRVLADAQGDAQGGQPGGGLPSLLITLLPIMLLFYLLILRPGKRQEQERQTMLGALKKNDKVVTSGGLIGTVAAIKDNEDEVTLRVDESSNVRLRVTKSSIVRVLSSAAAEAAKE